MLEKWVDQSYFEQTVPGCFVRMTFQSNRGQHEYMMCEIVQLQDNFLDGSN